MRGRKCDIRLENKFRWICEICTLFSFIGFVVGGEFYFMREDCGAYICAVIIVLSTLYSNVVSDSNNIDQGILWDKKTKWSKWYICISRIRYVLEKAFAAVLFILLLMYFFTVSNGGNIFKILAYYEVLASLWIVIILEIILLIFTVLLVAIEESALKSDVMNAMLR